MWFTSGLSVGEWQRSHMYACAYLTLVRRRAVRRAAVHQCWFSQRTRQRDEHQRVCLPLSRPPQALQHPDTRSTPNSQITVRLKDFDGGWHLNAIDATTTRPTTFVVITMGADKRTCVRGEFQPAQLAVNKTVIGCGHARTLLRSASRSPNGSRCSGHATL